MLFTLIAIGVPILLFILDALTPGSHGFGMIALMWLLIAGPLTSIYWIARVIKAATAARPDAPLTRF
jgi:hypothetical protein